MSSESARLIRTGNPMDPELAELIERARNLPPMTKEQIAIQRKSWAIGEMMLEHPEMTREEVERIYDEVIK